ncbi:MAG: phosphonate ABC transporter, permease protein PhnE [Pseudomonadota bacterium]
MLSPIRACRLSARLDGGSALRFVLLVGAAAAVIAMMVPVTPAAERMAAGVPRLGGLLGRMWPPETDPAFLARMGWRLLETMQIVLAGTVLGIALSLPVAWLAARGLTPLPWAAFAFKGLISLFRTVPDLVWALIFVVTVGLGAVAGTMTILVDTVGFCGRFVAEAMEDADGAPQEALVAFGAPRAAVLMAAVIPDALPSITGTALFALEKAVRSSVVLGLVGAGGIGQELKSAFDLFQYPKAATIMIAIFAIVLAMEWLTDRLRRRLQ